MSDANTQATSLQADNFGRDLVKRMFMQLPTCGLWKTWDKPVINPRLTLLGTVIDGGDVWVVATQSDGTLYRCACMAPAGVYDGLMETLDKLPQLFIGA